MPMPEPAALLPRPRGHSLSMPTPVLHRVGCALRCRRARRSHRTTVPRATHTLAARHTLAGCTRPVCCRLSRLAPLSRPCLASPPVMAIFCRPPPHPCQPHLCPPPSAARLACCVLLPAAMRCSTAGTLLRHALDTAVDKCGGGIVNGVREGGGGEGVERQEVWGGVTWLWWRCLCEKEPEWKERSQLERIAKK